MRRRSNCFSLYYLTFYLRGAAPAAGPPELPRASSGGPPDAPTAGPAVIQQSVIHHFWPAATPPVNPFARGPQQPQTQPQRNGPAPNRGKANPGKKASQPNVCMRSFQTIPFIIDSMFSRRHRTTEVPVHPILHLGPLNRGRILLLLRRQITFVFQLRHFNVILTNLQQAGTSTGTSKPNPTPNPRGPPKAKGQPNARGEPNAKGPSKKTV